MAFICSVIINIARSVWAEKGVTPKMSTPADYMPQWDIEENQIEDDTHKKQSIKDMKTILKSIAVAHGKKKS